VACCNAILCSWASGSAHRPSKLDLHRVSKLELDM
jgi:hypothetical protein